MAAWATAAINASPIVLILTKIGKIPSTTTSSKIKPETTRYFYIINQASRFPARLRGFSTASEGNVHTSSWPWLENDFVVVAGILTIWVTSTILKGFLAGQANQIVGAG